jgi:hypothetical protein
MREPNALMTTEALMRELGNGNLRVFDCTTYLEPPPPGIDEPYIAVPGRASFEAAHIPGADFLDLRWRGNSARSTFWSTPWAAARSSRIRQPKWTS